MIFLKDFLNKRPGFKYSFFYIFFCLFIFLVGCGPSKVGGLIKLEKIGSGAEWGAPKNILMHTPGEEIFLGILHPSAALFERVFNIKKAAMEHKEFIRLLSKKYGARIHTVVDTLLAGTIDKNGEIVYGLPYEKLKKLSKSFIIIDTEGFEEKEIKEQEKYLDETINKLHPIELVKIILNRPIVRLFKTKKNTGLTAQYKLSPVMNLYFTRDQAITTAKGVVLGRMNSPQRYHETKIIQFVLKKLGVKPIYEVKKPGFLEGGDFLPAKDVAFIGQGLRTNSEGIRQLLDAKAFGTKWVVVVKDFWKDQEQIHLDTFFNIIDKDLAVLAENRLNPKNEKMTLLADTYLLKNGKYQVEAKNINFPNYIKDHLGFHLISVPVKDQLNYGTNFLTVAPRTIIAIEGVSQGYKNKLKNAGVKATWINFDNLKGGYGAAHCTTQVLFRQPQN